jgi:hypothetical protein
MRVRSPLSTAGPPLSANPRRRSAASLGNQPATLIHPSPVVRFPTLPFPVPAPFLIFIAGFVTIDS